MADRVGAGLCGVGWGCGSICLVYSFVVFVSLLLFIFLFFLPLIFIMITYDIFCVIVSNVIAKVSLIWSRHRAVGPLGFFYNGRSKFIKVLYPPTPT